MTIKTFSRARSAVAAAKKVAEGYEVFVAGFGTTEKEPGRYGVIVELKSGTPNEVAAMFIAKGFGITHSVVEPQPKVEEQKDQQVEDKKVKEAVAEQLKKRPSNYINEVSDHRGVVAEVHAICDSMPEASRKEVIAACREAGIAYGTARTQYQKWFAKKKS